MLRLRPYNKNDAEIIMSWIKGENAFYKWTAGVLGEYPISAEQFNTVSNLMAFTAIDDNELTDMLWKIVRELVDDPSEFLMIALSQCFMKDMSIQKNESETRQKIYTKWYNFIQRSYGI